MTEYITAKELCKMLDVNRVDVAELTSIGELKAQKTKGRWKINKKSAENLKKKNQKKIESIQKEVGRLNDKRNLDLIKMDARGTEILSLERYIDGKARKAPPYLFLSHDS